MIGFLTGKVKGPKLVLTTGGVGYSVNCVKPLVLGDEVELLVTTLVREDAITLYGFTSEGEQKLFEQLIKVSGVGAVLALSILSDLGVGATVKALAAKDAKTLSKVKGLGVKRAEIICSTIRLSDEVLALAEGVEDSPMRPLLVGALRSMGYTENEVEEGVKVGLETGDDLGEAIKAALASMRGVAR